jgi:hypothetical protein
MHGWDIPNFNSEFHAFARALISAASVYLVVATDPLQFKDAYQLTLSLCLDALPKDDKPNGIMVIIRIPGLINRRENHQRRWTCAILTVMDPPDGRADTALTSTDVETSRSMSLGCALSGNE